MRSLLSPENAPLTGEKSMPRGSGKEEKKTKRKKQ